MLLKTISTAICALKPAKRVALAHCDGPCGIYDPASIRIEAEAAGAMTKKMLDLPIPEDHSDVQAMANYHNTLARYASIKEQQAHLAKTELLVLWTDYFKPPHLEQYPELHELFWQAAKLCSAVKVEVSAAHAQELMDAVKAIHDIFWATKNRDVPFYLAG